jgi:hypothetical protein
MLLQLCNKILPPQVGPLLTKFQVPSSPPQLRRQQAMSIMGKTGYNQHHQVNRERERERERV